MWRRPGHMLRAAGLAALLVSGSAPAPARDSLEYLPYGSVRDNPRPVAARHQGGLFRVSRQGRIAYLFGTVHVGMPGFFPLPLEVRRALRGASRVVVELDTRADAPFERALALHGSYPPGDDLRKHLSAPTVQALTAALHALGMPVASVARYKPWLVANVLHGMALEQRGYRRSEGVERVLLAQAHKRGARVTELESAVYQLSLYDTLDDAQSERYLQEALDGLADGSALHAAEAIVEAWASGDVRALDAALAASTAGHGVAAEFTRRVLLGRRNPEMAQHIERLMAQDSVTFVGVGLLHLLGANGLPQLLAQRGYLVERVY